MTRFKTKAISQLFSTALVGLIWIPQLSYANAFRCIDAHSSETKKMSAPPNSLASALERLHRTESHILVTDQGLPILEEITPPADPTLPYLLLLPGVRRPVFKTDLGYMALVNKGYGIATFSFSRQPFSLSLESSEGRSSIRNTSFGFQDLLKETNLVIQDLAKRGIHNVVPVSLSFSAAISPHLKGYPLIIETAPMTSWDAAVKSSKALEDKKMLQAMQFWNPFLSPFVRQKLNDGYREEFAKEIDEQMQLLSLDPKKRDEFLEGQTQLTRAAEGSDWSRLQLPPETRRIFFVGLKDHPRLLRHQLETFKRLMDTGGNHLLITIQEAGHFIPINQPFVYAALVDAILSNPDYKKGGLVMIGSTADDVTVINDPQEAAKRVQKLLNFATEDDKNNTAEELKKK